MQYLLLRLHVSAISLCHHQVSNCASEETTQRIECNEISIQCIVSSEAQFETWWWHSEMAETCSLSNKYCTTLLVVSDCTTLYHRIWPLKHENSCGYCIYHQVKNRNSAFFHRVLKCFVLIRATNSDSFPVQHWLIEHRVFWRLELNFYMCCRFIFRRVRKIA